MQNTAFTTLQHQNALVTLTKNGQPDLTSSVSAFTSAASVCSVSLVSGRSYLIQPQAPGVAVLTFAGPGSTQEQVTATVTLAPDQYTLTVTLSPPAP